MDVMDGVTPQWVKEITGVDLLWIDFFPFILPSTLPFKELLTRWLRDDDAFKLACRARANILSMVLKNFGVPCLRFGMTREGGPLEVDHEVGLRFDMCARRESRQQRMLHVLLLLDCWNFFATWMATAVDEYALPSQEILEDLELLIAGIILMASITYNMSRDL